MARCPNCKEKLRIKKIKQQKGVTIWVCDSCKWEYYSGSK